MMEQNCLGDPVKSPEIQEIILSNRTCMTRRQGFISMAISISLMNLCENIKINYKFIQPHAR